MPIVAGGAVLGQVVTGIGGTLGGIGLLVGIPIGKGSHGVPAAIVFCPARFVVVAKGVCHIWQAVFLFLPGGHGLPGHSLNGFGVDGRTTTVYELETPPIAGV